jgi:catechol 2,3-dioxygenase-like lactoylglutathione lyase family enzyme
MIFGAHAIVYAKDAERARAFFRDVLGLRHVDAGDGWLIFALPPAELGVHPGEESGRHELYLVCDDVRRTVRDLEKKGVRFTSPVADRGWGVLTTLEIPGGGEIGLYEPRHPTAIRAPGRAAAGGAKRAGTKRRGARAEKKSKPARPAARKPARRARTLARR